MRSGGPQMGESSTAIGPDGSYFRVEGMMAASSSSSSSSSSPDPNTFTSISASLLAVGGSRGAASRVIGMEPLVKGG